MARGICLRLLGFALLLGVLRSESDFQLEDALEGKGEAKPTLTPHKADAGDPGPAKTPHRPQPNAHGNDGGFSDSDLIGHTENGGRDDSGSHAGDGQQEQPQGLVPGIVGAVVVAVAGAVSSFVAYQKKKLCFKEGESSNV
ncbi:CD99 antigen isoform X2 [Ochotona curzoniae]|uniref:CD99 antigen isoform X2 n=1 Tax=Ochotona curzoniae TaxID=130825 RepID=UPI001B34A157|nr:CD99 antigen isoform X2 [Ochotona curzoniae]